MTKSYSTIDSHGDESRAEMLHRAAERQGVRPLAFDELLGPPRVDGGDDGTKEVDDFLALRREWRADEIARGGRQ